MKFIFRKKDYKDYVQDSLLESENIWYWKWKKKEVQFLHSRCSKCNNILIYDENKINNTVYFYCPQCKYENMNIKGGNYEYTQNILKREIKRKAFPKVFEKEE